MPALFFISFSLPAEIHLAIIDTGFCPSLIKKSRHIDIRPAVDLTGTVQIDCSKRSDPRLHGQWLMEEFLKFYNPKKELIKIHPLIVYDQKKEQKSLYWQKALDYLERNKIDFVLTASGLPLEQNEPPLSLGPNEIWFAPSGRTSPFVRKGQRLFPQELAPRENLFLIGDYFEGTTNFFDEELFYQDQIDYFFASGKGQFVGTSRAVGEAAGRALRVCPQKAMRACLKKVSRTVPLSLSKKTILTY